MIDGIIGLYFRIRIFLVCATGITGKLIVYDKYDVQNNNEQNNKKSFCFMRFIIDIHYRKNYRETSCINTLVLCEKPREQMISKKKINRTVIFFRHWFPNYELTNKNRKWKSIVFTPNLKNKFYVHPWSRPSKSV